ncbi:hypothetical protein CPAR01_06117 [Colletotrichum paranaense]|uniref:Uncharacterized protein n=2 Tax=Colletotrichum acutatum species complex TaxID=2707335 RepID=A0AAI9UIN4_9PEZI|nr:uncharacterized protein CPAR01_06117 [Colletotrichum paranaense]KAK1459177.1 hypothetical protein CMEL01_02176 [Colletotrichum melonis]KAK1542730.1 hypothetical protein CPAR01_06117 [Colletotrichum paranaense]
MEKPKTGPDHALGCMQEKRSRIFLFPHFPAGLHGLLLSVFRWICTNQVVRQPACLPVMSLSHLSASAASLLGHRGIVVNPCISQVPSLVVSRLPLVFKDATANLTDLIRCIPCAPARRGKLWSALRMSQ